MTLDLEAIKAREQAATYGPWVAHGLEVLTGSGEWVAEACLVSDGGVSIGDKDAEFIAHARTDVPALLAEVERLRALVDESEWDGYSL